MKYELRDSWRCSETFVMLEICLMYGLDQFILLYLFIHITPINNFLFD